MRTHNMAATVELQCLRSSRVRTTPFILFHSDRSVTHTEFSAVFTTIFSVV